ncbi:MAG: transposase [Opitutales bacterium]
MSRIAGGERLLGDVEKEVFRNLMWRVTDFSGVRLLTYCVMSNHFHVLVDVPESSPVSDAELLRRYSVLYQNPSEYTTLSPSALKLLLERDDEEAERTRARLLARMGDLSEFMKTLKQRFSIWYNKNHDRYGTLWAERFKSVLVEGKGNALQTMAAYIDLNPVRAGLVSDPKDYRFCGYAEASAGRPLAQKGLAMVWADHLGRGEENPNAAVRAHGELIAGKGGADGDAVSVRTATARAMADGESFADRADALRCRVRYFTDGVVLGSAVFVAKFSAHLGRGRKRPPTTYAMRGAEWGDLNVGRRLRGALFG